MSHGGVWGVLVALLVAIASPAHASGLLDRVRATGSLRCGAVERPGIAEALPGGTPAGVAVDLCRAVAVAVSGPSARVSFSLYDSPRSYDGLRRGGDEIGFLTGGEIAGQDLAGFVIPGPAVLISTIAIMVPENSSVHRPAELPGQTVCLMIGSSAQRALESVAAAQHLSISRLAFEEDVEMLDAYNAGRCGAVVGETTYLAEMRQNSGVRRLTSRLLAEVLTADPLVTVTPRGDGPSAADVAWVIDALLSADGADAWQGSASPAQDVPGLRPGWRAETIAAVGTYSAILRHNLTDRLGLAPGPNALWPAGLLLPPAVR